MTVKGCGTYAEIRSIILVRLLKEFMRKFRLFKFGGRKAKAKELIFL